MTAQINPLASPDMRVLMDQYQTPALPDGFADRVVARALSEKTATGKQKQQKPSGWKRTRLGSPWRRIRNISGGVVGFSLITAAAAATGIFGEPIHIPVISELAQKADLVVTRPQPAPRQTAAKEITPATPDKDLSLRVSLNDQSGLLLPRRALVRKLRENPRFQALRPAQKAKVFRRIQRRRLAIARRTNATGTPPALRRENRRAAFRNATPAQRERFVQMRNKAIERRKRRQDAVTIRQTPSGSQLPAVATLSSGSPALSVQAQPVVRTPAAAQGPELPITTNVGDGASMADDATTVSIKSSSADATVISASPETSVVPPAPKAPIALREKASRLREQYRTATPAERAKIRATMRERRQALKDRAGAKRKRDLQRARRELRHRRK